MNKILEQLYNGEIYPSENIVPTNPKYRPLTRKISDEREAHYRPNLMRRIASV